MRLALLWGRGTLSMFAVIAGGLVLGLLGAPAIVTAGTSGAPHPAGSPQSDLGRELPSLRTASSDTYERGGLRVLKAYTHPVNYRDGAGKWQPIEDSLVQAEGGRLAHEGLGGSGQLAGDARRWGRVDRLRRSDRLPHIAGRRQLRGVCLRDDG
jgi:hypothetical protein